MKKVLQCIKYIVLLILILFTVDYIIYSIKIIINSTKCKATIVETGSREDKIPIKAWIDYAMDGIEYKTPRVWTEYTRNGIEYRAKVVEGGSRYSFSEPEKWVKIGDEVEVWVNKNNPKDIHYISFRRMAIWTIITVGYSIFIIVDIIVKRKRKRKLCNF